MQGREPYRGSVIDFLNAQFQHAILCLALRADALDALDPAILNGEDRFEVQCRTNEALRTANASTTVQEFQSVHSKKNTCILMRSLCQSNGILEACPCLDGACNCQRLE